MEIGIFSTFIEPAALDLVQTVIDAVRTNQIPNTKVSFIFSNREIGEHPTTDALLNRLSTQGIELIPFSAARFNPEVRKKARQEEKEGKPSLIKDWRNQFGKEVLRRLPPTDLDLLLGDMFIWGDNLCEKRNGINLHPALPNGPKGEWYNVLWELIKNGALETGVMMHKVTAKLDRGPTVALCRFSIRGPKFDELWDQLPNEKDELQQVIQQGMSEREKTNHPLHQEIRKHGLTREFPLIIQTTRAFAEGNVRVEGESVVDSTGRPLKDGYDLTTEIDEIAMPQLEGVRSGRKERLR